MVQCPGCARQQHPRLLCPECGSPLPAAQLDYFAAFDLPRRLQIDPVELERRYHELGRRIHPDKFGSQSAAVRAASLGATALLTQAYRNLRDPVARGLYWLRFNGEKLAENNKQVPPDLAELIFEVQELISTLKDDPDGEIAALRSDLAAYQRQLEGAIEASLAALKENFRKWDEAAPDGERASLINELKQILSRIAYLRTLERDLGRGLEGQAG